MTKRLLITLDVLSDGSEHTGVGTLFLSVWRLSKTQDDQLSKTDAAETTCAELFDTTSPLARYAISGLGDATARLCADQRLKLSTTRSVFLPESKGSSWDGMTALFLSLFSAGAPSLHVVSPQLGNDDKIESIAGTILSKHKNLDIRTCQVPFPVKGYHSVGWWLVYEDDFLIAYGKMYGESSSIYLFSIKENEESQTTVAVFPPNFPHNSACHSKELSSETIPTSPVNYIISLNPAVCGTFETEEPAATTTTTTTNNDHPITFTIAMRSNNETTLDPGLLIQAQACAQVNHEAQPKLFLDQFAAPDLATTFSKNVTADTMQLRSCTSVILNNRDTDQAIQNSKTLVVDRRLPIWERTGNKEKIRNRYESIYQSLSSLLDCKVQVPPSVEPSIIDNDEIELDDESSEDSQDNNKPQRATIHQPHMIVLGTGCASPSATRGASGYALVFPSSTCRVDGVGSKNAESNDMVLLDCGEGAATMLSRFARHTDWRREIKGIWISHAHLDHFGGLPTVLRILLETYRAQRAENETQPDQKMCKVLRDPPWVMAPTKVLAFLDATFHSRKGVEIKTGQSLFVPMRHDTQPPRFPRWTWFQNIKVDHSCCHSYGLLLGWKTNADGCAATSHFLCFSGDTRPCEKLVAVCREALVATQMAPETDASRSQRIFLLHEATFHRDDQDQAIQKKHSTADEAMRVAFDIPAARLLMTHFSHRYVTFPSELFSDVQFVKSQTSSHRNQQLDFSVGLALDGMTITMS